MKTADGLAAAIRSAVTLRRQRRAPFRGVGLAHALVDIGVDRVGPVAATNPSSVNVIVEPAASARSRAAATIAGSGWNASGDATATSRPQVAALNSNELQTLLPSPI